MGEDKRFDIVALGEPMIEFNEIAPKQYQQGFGGDTANFAVAAARQGARVSYCTRLGDDWLGHMLLNLWAEEKVDASSVQIDPAAQTAAYFVTHDHGGHHFHYLRANSAASRMQPDNLAVDILRATRFLHVSGTSQAISVSACNTVAAAINVAREAGARISYDPNLRLQLWSLERAREVIAGTIPLVDVFLPSYDESLTFTGADDRDGIFAWCARHGANQVVLKCGAEGAWIWKRAEGVAHHVPGFPVSVVDATGAGDCFDGALIARLIAGDDLINATRYANVAAALSTTGYGAVAPIPRQATVLAHMSGG